MFLISLLLSAIAGLALFANAIPTIEIKGSKFFTSEGDQFFIKGIAYQLVPDDPLINTTQCNLDASLMKTLGANAIRVYHVDPAGDHDGCMQAFEDAGIYLFVDLDTFDTQIEEGAPHWNESQLNAFTRVMDEFSGYENTAGFFVGNEVLTTGNGSVAAPYVKAASRDVKAHRDSQSYRKVPVGYSAADISTLRPMLQNFLACGNKSDALDFFALNAYEWCGSDTSFLQSGYSALTTQIKDILPIPIFFSETGCITVRPRTFADQSAIFSDDMSPYWSGAIAYEWIEEANNYGLVSYGEKVDPSDPEAPPDGYTRSGTPTPISPDFENLKSQWKTVDPSSVSMNAYSPSVTAVDCPAMTSGVWNVEQSAALPSLGQTYDAAATSASGSGGGQGSATGSAAPAGTSGAAMPSFKNDLWGMSAGLVGLGFTVLMWL
ncbi:glycoside hydrolase family 72 protein [Aulographum hederae CBS 113979]|uniref:1,3-beta-glucanosyltransferase n=1 Tax=Aulographum hederae CBS 113979 TaxID=1176131 RepID=A0A6G1GR63_9PEZI|nr:glycoside hydrolase family 72 protein [Aulographum hederae CBS 113979]